MGLPINFIKTPSVFTAIIGTSSYNVPSDHVDYNELVSLIVNDKDSEGFLDLFNKSRVTAKAISGISKFGVVEIQYNAVFFNGEEINGVIVDRILQMKNEGLDFEPMVKFLENLMNNPSKRAVDELYKFLEYEHLPITDDGHFLAYKSVRSNYYDKHSGTILNKVGSVIEIPRNKVDDDADVGCSYGLHVGSLQYSGPGGSFNAAGDKVLIVKVNPADVVSVPKDYSHQKVRCCRYEVIGEFKEALDAPVYSAAVDSVVQLKPVANIANVGETIRFNYETDGVVKSRTILVESTNGNYITGVLQYPEVEEGAYRTFLKDKIEQVVVISSDDDEDDWDDDDEDDWDNDDDDLDEDLDEDEDEDWDDEPTYGTDTCECEWCRSQEENE